MGTWKVLSGPLQYRIPLRHKSQCFLCHCSKMEKVGGWQSQERWMSTRNQRRDFPTQVPSTQPLTQPLPQHAKEHPVITATTVVLNLDTVPRSTPTFPVCVCLLQLVFDISAFPACLNLSEAVFSYCAPRCYEQLQNRLDMLAGNCPQLTHVGWNPLNEHWIAY